MLTDEIKSAQALVKTDAYQMSVGEIVSMYENNEIVIDPEFQRLFRWTASQKSKLIESFLLGIPIPSIFVFEQADAKWELVDALQRVSTLLEFMGKLRSPDGTLARPSILEATKYLPSLHNVVWEKSPAIPDVDMDDQVQLDKSHQLAIRRARIGVEILKRPSSERTKFDLFQRLNAGGTQANPQELRNCIIIMVNNGFYRRLKAAAERASFKELLGINEEQAEKQRHMELAVRFLVHSFVPYDGKLDIEEYMDNGIIELAGDDNKNAEAIATLDRTFDLIQEVTGPDGLRRFQNGEFVGRKGGLVALECVAVGIGLNLREILATPDHKEFLVEKIKTVWLQPSVAGLSSPGIRGTTRIQMTVPLGRDWFRP